MPKRQTISIAVILLGVILLMFACGDDNKPTQPSVTVKNTNLMYYDYLDLETDSVETPSSPGNPSSSASMDFWIAYNSVRAVHGVVFQTAGRQIAHLPGRTFASVGASDTAGAPFTSSLVDTSFDANRVILFKTDMGAVYKLGNPVETVNYGDGLTFDYAKIAN